MTKPQGEVEIATSGAEVEKETKEVRDKNRQLAREISDLKGERDYWKQKALDAGALDLPRPTRILRTLYQFRYFATVALIGFGAGYAYHWKGATSQTREVCPPRREARAAPPERAEKTLETNPVRPDAGKTRNLAKAAADTGPLPKDAAATRPLWKAAAETTPLPKDASGSPCSRGYSSRSVGDSKELNGYSWQQTVVEKGDSLAALIAAQGKGVAGFSDACKLRIIDRERFNQFNRWFKELNGVPAHRIITGRKYYVPVLK